ncbi:MAG TPA: phosphatase PAP2 family protein [Anaerolineales bacterium]|nr:phosphatase PAP2 family protein [Anaerolineales bacterium]HLO32666.1 phosphatase PAP2 family protein [Anaerolineales bacterium]
MAKVAKAWTMTNNHLTTTSSGLRSPGWFARWPMIGLGMILIGGLVFGFFAYDVQTHGPFFQRDAPLSKTLYSEARNAPARITELLIFGFFVGKELVQVITVILALYFLHKRFWPELAMLIIGLGGGALIWYFLIGVFNRPRPIAQIGITVTEPSFPSGHTITAVLGYGLLAYLLFSKMPSRFWKWVLVIATLLTIAYIGVSRLVLGGHYLTDILAGYGLGLAWAGLVFTLIERFFLRRKSNSVK